MGDFADDMAAAGDPEAIAHVERQRERWQVVKPRLLDLFCGAGGCSVGYARTGFEVVGVDIESQPHYPFGFIQADALHVLREPGRYDGPIEEGFDAIHASPPCQADSKTFQIMQGEHESLIDKLRPLLEATGLPYVIENVKGAPLRDPQMLEGQMFGLNTHRPRLFETNWGFEAPLLRPPPPRQAKMGRKPKPGEAIQVIGHFTDMPAAQEAMGIDWMTRAEMAEAIPPAYTEFVGTALLAHIEANSPCETPA